MAEAFRLPGSTYEELVNIIVAYGTRDDAANPRDVGKLNSVHQSSVSRNNAFLKQVGVVGGEREKLLVTAGAAGPSPWRSPAGIRRKPAVAGESWSRTTSSCRTSSRR